MSLERPRRTAEEWGEIAGAVWFLGGFLALFVGVIAQVGPSAWVAAWQVRHWGYDNVLLSFLPGFAALIAPFAVLACLPRRPGFWAGARHVLWSSERPRATTLPPKRIAHRLGMMAKICAGLSMLSLIATGASAWWLMRPGDPPPGTALPALSLARAATAARLPSPALLTEATPHPELAWEHDEVLRRTTVHDVYVPLTGPGWRPGEPVPALELLRGGEPIRPLEGTLSRGVPGWLADAMREHAIALGDGPVVLTRHVLGGVVPAPDWVDALAPLFLGIPFALVFAAIAWSCRRARRRIERAQAAV